MIVWLEAWYKSVCPLLVHDFIFSISFYLSKYTIHQSTWCPWLQREMAMIITNGRNLCITIVPFFPSSNLLIKMCFLNVLAYFLSSLFYLTWQSDQSAQGGWIWLVREGLKSLQMKTMKTSLKCQRWSSHIYWFKVLKVYKCKLLQPKNLYTTIATQFHKLLRFMEKYSSYYTQHFQRHLERSWAVLTTWIKGTVLRSGRGVREGKQISGPEGITHEHFTFVFCNLSFGLVRSDCRTSCGKRSNLTGHAISECSWVSLYVLKMLSMRPHATLSIAES